jgi:hypothetical protein
LGVEGEGAAAVDWACATVLSGAKKPNTAKLTVANEPIRAAIWRTLQKEKVIKGKEKSTFRLIAAQKL